MNEEPKNQIKDLKKIQRRVLGVLMEKAFTTPDAYPLTLKALTTGCNQKSNRSPQSSYDEGQIQDALDDMRQDLLVAEVFPGGGRTARYRHYMRNKFDFSEQQLAIMAELMLRGRQQLGELRTRASRMVRIDSQEQLRQELTSLQQKGYLQANGPLERRGIEVDHTFYLEREGKTLGDAPPPPADTPAAGTSSGGTPSGATSLGGTPPSAATSSAPAPATAALSVDNSAVEAVESLVQQLKLTISEQAETIRNLESAMNDMEDRLQRLERDLGV